ncbi:alpha-glucoside-specific PTS transporter subunit IIBC [Companilactobacillus heilongjiangensis]|uniref:PTS alpha-glucoside transporter subunit IICB n=1 Tax=Companilactobacillus heilongjiangensis TaxID=1074467 RepID=A0A0K2L9E5_9LACO|nr:alpha-glucoside-specific PTS transporter subunit IIBC [Companilactobacillus heilongjiangensis]ALB27906.1 PTS alpha-glucoside transporter subunit IICB [Companilactobacillus heilongjiangensis]
MMQKLQKFGAAMFVPVLLFSFAGLIVAFGSLFTNPEIFHNLAQPTTSWYGIWFTIEEGGWTIFRQIPLLFVVGLPIGLAKKSQGRAALESLVTYLTFNYFIGGMLSQWGPFFGVNNYAKDITANSTNGGLTMIAGIKTLDTSIVGALVVAGIVVWLHNRYFDKKLPEWLGTFQGSSYVVILGFISMFALAFVTCLVWPKIQLGISSLQGFMKNTGVIGVWVYCFLQRVLIPTGLHHFIYIPFQYGPAAVAGGLQPYWLNHLADFAGSTQSLKALAPSMGFELFGNEKVFGIPAICYAFYVTAKKDRKKQTAALLIPAGLTSIAAGITEPVEFTFLFAAPVLWFVHSFLAATMDATMYAFGVVGQFDGGLIQFISMDWIPLWANHWHTWVTQIIIGLIFALIYFVVFKTLIEKFDFATPGREAEGEATKLINKKEYKSKKATGTDASNPYIERAQAYLSGLGGTKNIEDMTSCATRLRITVKDPEKVESDEMFKSNKAVAVVRHGKAIQVIVGLDVAQVLEKMQELSSGPIEPGEDNNSEPTTTKDLTPIQQRALLILDSLGTIENVENIETNDGKITVTVVDPASVDSKDIFDDLGLNIDDVQLNDKKATISMKDAELYAHTMLSMI